MRRFLALAILCAAGTAIGQIEPTVHIEVERLLFGGERIVLDSNVIAALLDKDALSRAETAVIGAAASPIRSGQTAGAGAPRR